MEEEQRDMKYSGIKANCTECSTKMENKVEGTGWSTVERQLIINGADIQAFRGCIRKTNLERNRQRQEKQSNVLKDI